MPTVQVLLFSRRPPTLEPSAVFESAANAIHAQKRLAAPQTGVAQPEDDWSVGEESVVQIKPPQRLKSAPVHSALKRCILPSNGHPLALPPLPPPTTSENIITASLAIPKPDYDTLAVIRQYFVSLFDYTPSIQLLRPPPRSCTTSVRTTRNPRYSQLAPFALPRCNILSSRLPQITSSLDDAELGSSRSQDPSARFLDLLQALGRREIQQRIETNLLPRSFGRRKGSTPSGR